MKNENEYENRNENENEALQHHTRGGTATNENEKPKRNAKDSGLSSALFVGMCTSLGMATVIF